MSDNYNDDPVNPEDLSLVAPVSEQVSTDAIADLKTGIYNLYINLLNNLIIKYGYEQAIMISTDFLDEISINFKNILKDDQEK